MEASLKINEIFFSIQGESLLAGKPTVFVRTTGCNLRCGWCDTKYAYYEGRDQTFSEILAEIKKYDTPYVCLTGGEPMAQKESIPFMEMLCQEGYTVSLETSGSFSVKGVPAEVIKVIDLKCPDSGETASMVWENCGHVTKNDQFKFVVASKEDFEWAEQICRQYDLNEKCTVLYSPVYGKVKPSALADWILEGRSKVTLQLQMHKTIWGEDVQGK